MSKTSNTKCMKTNFLQNESQVVPLEQLYQQIPHLEVKPLPGEVNERVSVNKHVESLRMLSDWYALFLPSPHLAWASILSCNEWFYKVRMSVFITIGECEE